MVMNLANKTPNPDVLEELMEQLLVKKECLKSIDGEIEKQTKTDGLKEEVQEP